MDRIINPEDANRKRWTLVCVDVDEDDFRIMRWTAPSNRVDHISYREYRSHIQDEDRRSDGCPDDETMQRFFDECERVGKCLPFDETMARLNSGRL